MLQPALSQKFGQATSQDFLNSLDSQFMYFLMNYLIKYILIINTNVILNSTTQNLFISFL